jgi:hypothetical protein
VLEVLSTVVSVDSLIACREAEDNGRGLHDLKERACAAQPAAERGHAPRAERSEALI